MPYGIGRKAKSGPTISEVTNDIDKSSDRVIIYRLADVVTAAEEIAQHGGFRCIKLGKTELLVFGGALTKDQWVSLIECVSGNSAKHDVQLTSRETNIRDAGGQCLTFVFADIRPATPR